MAATLAERSFGVDTPVLVRYAPQSATSPCTYLFSLISWANFNHSQEAGVSLFGVKAFLGERKSSRCRGVQPPRWEEGRSCVAVARQTPGNPFGRYARPFSPVSILFPVSFSICPVRYFSYILSIARFPFPVHSIHPRFPHSFLSPSTSFDTRYLDFIESITNTSSPLSILFFHTHFPSPSTPFDTLITSNPFRPDVLMVVPPHVEETGTVPFFRALSETNFRHVSTNDWQHGPSGKQLGNPPRAQVCEEAADHSVGLRSPVRRRLRDGNRQRQGSRLGVQD